jgi:type VI protein secretion system component Hcp
MSSRIRLSFVAVVLCSFLVAGANAATNMSIRFDGIASGQDIDVLSWSHGGTQGLTLTKYMDTSTNELLKFCWSGKQIAKATLSCYRSDGAADKPVKYLEVSMEHVVISNFSISGGPGDIPVENVSLDYGTIRYSYLDMKHPGGVPGPAVKSMTATAPARPRLAAGASAPCSAKLPSGKSVDVRSLNVNRSHATFATSGAVKKEPGGSMTLTCGGTSTVFKDAKVGDAAGGKVSVAYAAIE